MLNKNMKGNTMNKWQNPKFLKTLSPKALETLTTKMTGISADKGKNSSRKAEMKLRQNRKFKSKKQANPESKYIGK